MTIMLGRETISFAQLLRSNLTLTAVSMRNRVHRQQHLHERPKPCKSIPTPAPFSNRIPLPVGFLVTSTGTWTTELLWLAPSVVGDEKGAVVGDQGLLQLVLAVLIDVLLVVGNLLNLSDSELYTAFICRGFISIACDHEICGDLQCSWRWPVG